MYTEFYKFTGRPFNLTPDHRFFYASQTHKRAMAYLTYGLNAAEGFVVLTGDIGTGKSTLVDHLLSLIDSSHYVAAKIITTQTGADDTLRMVASAFGIQQEGADKATLLRRLESFLVSSHNGRHRILLFIDESQNLPASSLEELRMLSNIQVGGLSPLQIFLLGQPQFRNTLGGENLAQLRQRVIAWHHLSPMDADETRAYIEHRLHIVGWKSDPDFSPDAFAKIYQHTRGIPRQINLLCTRILLFGMLEEKHQIHAEVVERVQSEMLEETEPAASGSSHDQEGGGPAVAAEIESNLTIEQRIRNVERRVQGQYRLIQRALELAARWLEVRTGDGREPHVGGDEV